MSGALHVFTVVSGFGLRVVPFAPFRASLGPSPHVLDVECDAVVGEARFARLSADGGGGYTSKIAEVSSLHDVVEVEAGPKSDHWRLETHAFSARLPTGATLHSTPPGDPSPFLLVAPGEIALYLQSAHGAPRLSAMCAPGQEVTEESEDSIALTYVHAGEPWLQRHSTRAPGVVVTVQSPCSAEERARELWEQFLLSFTLSPPADTA